MIRNLENSPSRLGTTGPEPDLVRTSFSPPPPPPVDPNMFILERLGMLEAELKMFVVSNVTPASTKNSLAEGSRFSRLEE